MIAIISYGFHFKGNLLIYLFVSREVVFCGALDVLIRVYNAIGALTSASRSVAVVARGGAVPSLSASAPARLFLPLDLTLAVAMLPIHL